MFCVAKLVSRHFNFSTTPEQCATYTVDSCINIHVMFSCIIILKVIVVVINRLYSLVARTYMYDMTMTMDDEN
jgi:hypothetical protein